jgi:endonuclease YncB( thermonuclease family)
MKLIYYWLICFGCAFFSANAAVLNGAVVGITDGDTITVLDDNKQQHKIRLMGIDAPEKAQAFGAASKKALSDLTYQKSVTVDYKKQDRYERKVGKVIMNNQDICLTMIELGVAWHYKDYEKEQSKTDRDLYSQAELKARESRIGLWQDSTPIKPSEFRRK